MAPDAPNLLIVDDLDANLLALEGLLRGCGARVLVARSGPEALELLLRHEIALALVDVQMPEMDGFQLAGLMHGTERTRAIPIIFVTAGALRHELRFHGYEVGAVDFLFKPIDPLILRSKVKVFLELARQRAELAARNEENTRLALAHAEAERRARASEAHLQRVLDNLFTFVAVLTPEGRVLEVNRAALSAAAIRAEDVLGLDFWDCSWWNHCPIVQEQLRGACARAAAGETVRYDVVVRMAGDSRMWIDFQVAPLRDAEGRITHLIPSGLDIGERKRTEEALGRERALLESLLEACPAAVVMADAQGTLLRVNPANERLWGRGPATQSVDDYRQWKGWWADDSTRAGQPLRPGEWAMARALRGEVVTGDLVEIEPFDQPGERRTTINAGAPVRDPSGRIVGAVIAQIDVSELKRVERALRESEERARRQMVELEALYDAAPLGIGVIDTELRFRRVNRPLAEINGVPAEAHIGRHVREIVPSLTAQADEAVREVMARGEPLQVEIRGETPAQPGVERIWDEIWYPMRDEGGAVLGAAVIVEEVTERRRAEQALRDSEVMFRELGENVPQLAWMAHPDGSIFWFNHRCYDYTGMSLAELQGWGWLAVHHPDFVDAVTSGFRFAFAAGRPWEDTFPIRGRDGEYRWFLSRAFPIRDQEGRITRWFGTNTDVTTLRETEGALRKAQETIRQHANHLESVVADRTARLSETVQELEAFSYSIAHDMRAPLRSMLGFSELLLEEKGGSLDAEGRDFLGRIRSSARRLDQLIQDVLNYSRIVRDELPLSAVDARALVMDLIDTYPNLRAAASCIAVAEDIPRVRANPAALTQVFSNLLSNAVKFRREGVPPSIRVRGERPPAGDCGPGAWVRLWVEDNGIGLDASAQPRLFRMFQRFATPGRYEGTGIGLAIARKATERMGGSIGVVSAAGEGSRFWILLPAPDTPHPTST